MDINEYLKTIPKDMNGLFMAIRECVLSTDSNFEEAIKWKNCLTYVYNQKNLIQTVLGKNKISLIFHNGAKFKDEKGLLIGEGNKVRTLRLNHENFECEVLKFYVESSILVEKK